MKGNNVMLRNLGISLLLLGLLGTAIDGFRVRERVRNANPGSTASQDNSVHTAEGGMVPPPS
jgi:hypothetical protein